VLCKMTQNPTVLSMKAAIRVLRYLKGTLEYKLTYHSSTSLGKHAQQLTGYVDAAYADNLESRRSTMGWIWMLGGAAVTWASKIEKLVTIGTANAEYVALSEACRVGKHLRSMLQELHEGHDGPTLVYEDNQSCVQMVMNNTAGGRALDIRYHWIREAVQAKKPVFTLVWTKSEDMVADMMTKGLDAATLQKHANIAFGWSF
jgi:hypothetical protein